VRSLRRVTFVRARPSPERPRRFPVLLTCTTRIANAYNPPSSEGHGKLAQGFPRQNQRKSNFPLLTSPKTSCSPIGPTAGAGLPLMTACSGSCVSLSISLFVHDISADNKLLADPLASARFEVAPLQGSVRRPWPRHEGRRGSFKGLGHIGCNQRLRRSSRVMEGGRTRETSVSPALASILSDRPIPTAPQERPFFQWRDSVTSKILDRFVSKRGIHPSGIAPFNTTEKFPGPPNANSIEKGGKLRAGCRPQYWLDPSNRRHTPFFLCLPRAPDVACVL